jgi:hypothetical protein
VIGPAAARRTAGGRWMARKVIITTLCVHNNSFGRVTAVTRENGHEQVTSLTGGVEGGPAARNGPALAQRPVRRASRAGGGPAARIIRCRAAIRQLPQAGSRRAYQLAGTGILPSCSPRPRRRNNPAIPLAAGAWPGGIAGGIMPGGGGGERPPAARAQHGVGRPCRYPHSQPGLLPRAAPRTDISALAEAAFGAYSLTTHNNMDPVRPTCPFGCADTCRPATFRGARASVRGEESSSALA